MLQGQGQWILSVRLSLDCANASVDTGLSLEPWRPPAHTELAVARQYVMARRQ